MALTVFKHFPQVKKVRAGLLFVISKDLIKDSYEEQASPILWNKWLTNYNRMETAFDKNVWNPKPSGLCRRHCPVTECVHNGSH
jgi:hypothetical protein